MTRLMSRRAFLRRSSVTATLGLFPWILGGSTATLRYADKAVSDLQPDMVRKFAEHVRGPVFHPDDQG
ncbi:hypothetical protein ACFL6U_03065 [Planctomycetota bacterium]